MGRPFKLQVEDETLLTQIVESDLTVTLEEIGGGVVSSDRRESLPTNAGHITEPHWACVPAQQ